MRELPHPAPIADLAHHVMAKARQREANSRLAMAKLIVLRRWIRLTHRLAACAIASLVAVVALSSPGIPAPLPDDETTLAQISVDDADDLTLAQEQIDVDLIAGAVLLAVILFAAVERGMTASGTLPLLTPAGARA